MELQLFRHEILHYWAGTPNQHRQTNSLYRRIRIVLHKGKFRGATASPGARFRLRSSRRMAQPLQHHGASQRSPFLVQGRGRFVLAWEDQREHDCGWGIFGALFGRSGTEQACSTGYRSGMRFLVSTLS